MDCNLLCITVVGLACAIHFWYVKVIVEAAVKITVGYFWFKPF
jgi:hypothetical protein